MEVSASLRSSACGWRAAKTLQAKHSRTCICFNLAPILAIYRILAVYYLSIGLDFFINHLYR
jgi:hypothetical protein